MQITENIKDRRPKGRVKGIKMSEDFCKRTSERQIGEKNHTWKGGISLNKRLYMDIFKKEHPNYFKEHRINNRDKYRMYSNNRKYKIKGATGTITKDIWDNIKDKFNNKCANPECPNIGKNVKLTVDHIIPISKGGTNEKDNIQPLCLNCNSRKSDKIIKYK